MNYELFEKCFIGSIKDAILKENTTEIPKEINSDFLVKMTKMHKLSSLLYPVFKEKGFESAELYKDFSFWAMVGANQQYYLEKIKARFEEEKIRFVCIKGIYLKTLYPEEYMRSSNDLDIFVDDENTEKARDIMVGLGFKVERFSHAMQDDAYNIGSFVHVEIHRELISNKCPWDKKCQEIIDRIVPKSEGSYEYMMTKEDFYLHMIAHMAKHFKYSGCGIKMVLDIWVYLSKFGNAFDRDILDQRLKYCGLYTFEREIAKLVDYWFNGKDADNRTKTLARYVFESGMFGNIEQYLATEMAANIGNGENRTAGTSRGLLKALFLPYKNMSLVYPKLQKYPFLLPYYWILRALKTLIFRRDRIAETAKRYDGIDMNYIKDVAELKKSLDM